MVALSVSISASHFAGNHLIADFSLPAHQSPSVQVSLSFGIWISG